MAENITPDPCLKPHCRTVAITSVKTLDWAEIAMDTTSPGALRIHTGTFLGKCTESSYLLIEIMCLQLCNLTSSVWCCFVRIALTPSVLVLDPSFSLDLWGEFTKISARTSAAQSDSLRKVRHSHRTQGVIYHLHRCAEF